MPVLRLFHFAAVALCVIAIARTQTVRPGLREIPEPPVPADPLELVTGAAQPVTDAVERASVLQLLTMAHTRSNVRAYPYDVKTGFTTYGSSSFDRSWQMEDTTPQRGIYRWTAQGPSYSSVNLFVNRLLYTNQPAGGVPLRLAQVRTAIFFNSIEFGERASVRTFAGSLNGTAVTCVLVARMFQGKPVAGPRRWDEEESCVDPKSGLLLTYSFRPRHLRALRLLERVVF